jgi:hypothetical protein
LADAEALGRPGQETQFGKAALGPYDGAFAHPGIGGQGGFGRPAHACAAGSADQGRADKALGGGDLAGGVQRVKAGFGKVAVEHRGDPPDDTDRQGARTRSRKGVAKRKQIWQGSIAAKQALPDVFCFRFFRLRAALCRAVSSFLRHCASPRSGGMSDRRRYVRKSVGCNTDVT